MDVCQQHHPPASTAADVLERLCRYMCDTRLDTEISFTNGVDQPRKKDEAPAVPLNCTHSSTVRYRWVRSLVVIFGAGRREGTATLRPLDGGDRTIDRGGERWRNVVATDSDVKSTTSCTVNK